VAIAASGIRIYTPKSAKRRAEVTEWHTFARQTVASLLHLSRAKSSFELAKFQKNPFLTPQIQGNSRKVCNFAAK